MIGPDWCRVMAAYNTEMNRRLYAAADTLDDAVRRADGGAFWGSIHGTLSHLLWGDTMWMSRFDGWERPPVGMKDSPRMVGEWGPLKAARAEADGRIEAWAGRLDEARLAAPLTWLSGATGRELTMPLWVTVAHFFNHQTHHRGQAHALLTRAGAATGDTDLPWVVDLPSPGIAP
ncbi:damage-inducible protein DinB [Roseomonas eburnea]|uniref:Damage-inducible protein DinB n=1 Tax=Neoroseomonas eburnea TaxID=1346889 RepID=A0A9X9XID1_9PROT|nr:DinB family protein [Neoroseomonas eburnea]MBR0683467.1 damage-inducible protein DinB [Neoroseomonas eburnea]